MSILYFLNQNILSLPFYLSLLILIFTGYLEIYKKPFLRKHIRRIFLYGAALIFIYLFYIAYLQFIAFYEGPLLGPLLGTADGFRWFLGYVQTHFWNDYLISLPIAILFVLTAYYFNKKYNERFFEKEEPFMAALGILLVGYPGFLFYLILVLLLPTVASAFFLRNGERLPLYHFWIPTAIVVVLLVHFWAGGQWWWSTFRF